MDARPALTFGTAAERDGAEGWVDGYGRPPGRVRRSRSRRTAGRPAEQREVDRWRERVPDLRHVRPVSLNTGPSREGAALSLSAPWTWPRSAPRPRGLASGERCLPSLTRARRLAITHIFP